MAILAFVFLRETVGAHHIGAIIIGFIGVLIVVRPCNEGSVNLCTLVAIARHRLYFSTMVVTDRDHSNFDCISNSLCWNTCRDSDVVALENP